MGLFQRRPCEIHLTSGGISEDVLTWPCDDVCILKGGNSSHLQFYTAAEEISNVEPSEKQHKADQNVKDVTGGEKKY